MQHDAEAPRGRRARVAAWVGLAVLAATLCNGASAYLKRVGLVDAPDYAHYLAAYCPATDAGRSGAGVICGCTTIAWPASTDVAVRDAYLAALPASDYLYRDSGWALGLKLAKDALFVAFVLVSLMVFKAATPAPRIGRAPWPLLPLLAVAGVGFAHALWIWGAPFALVGLRSFAFLGVAAVGGWIVRELHAPARWVGALLLVEGAAVGAELVFGMPLRACPHSFRALGTLVMPNSLGVFAVVALAFHASFSPGPRGFRMLAPVAAFLLVASGSATGLVALFLLLGWLAATRMPAPYRPAFGAALVVLAALLVAGLPRLTHRPDLFASVLSEDGRLGTLREAVHRSDAIEALIGRGVGYGSNSATSMAARLPSDAIFADAAGAPIPLDSTVTLLFTQLGILGVAAFYGLIGWAFLHDARARPMYLVIAVSSLMINISETFPANFLLGLTLAHSLFATGARATTPAAAPPGAIEP